MQPEKPQNYWQDNQKTTDVPEMYTPTPEPAEAVNQSVQETSSKPAATPTDPIKWSASEYFHEEKNSTWFAIFGVVVAILIAIDLLLIKSYTFSVLVVVMAASVIIYSRRPPRIIDYTLSVDQGLYIGEKLYHFSDFRAFGLIRDHEQYSIMLIPVKRFEPGVSVYFPDEVGEKVVDILGARLPMENLKLDAIDIIVRKLRL